jgi:hypothetical protein
MQFTSRPPPSSATFEKKRGHNRVSKTSYHSLMNPEVVDWLVVGDPSIRWQVERDLLESPETVWSATQNLVATEGWGARFLERRGDDGLWAKGLYVPKWTSTTYTMLQLWRMGLPRTNPEALASVGVLVERPVWKFGKADKAIFETCVAGFGLALTSWFTVESSVREELVEALLERQLDDGGWNCRAGRTRSVHGSFHTSINVLEGLREYCSSGGRQKSDVEAAEDRGREFFSSHHLYRSHRTDRVFDTRMTRLPFPPRWHHDVLRGLDYYRAADAGRDERLDDPMELLVGHRRKSGRWPIHPGYGGAVWFNMETGRSPSRWNTMRALRVLKWWDS